MINETKRIKAVYTQVHTSTDDQVEQDQEQHTYPCLL